MPYRVVIDPNVFVSALMTKPDSPTLAVARAVTTGKLRFVACPTLLQELSEVAHRERFRRWFTVEDAQHLLDALTLIAEMHPDRREFHRCAPTPTTTTSSRSPSRPGHRSSSAETARYRLPP